MDRATKIDKLLASDTNPIETKEHMLSMCVTIDRIIAAGKRSGPMGSFNNFSDHAFEKIQVLYDVILTKERYDTGNGYGYYRVYIGPTKKERIAELQKEIQRLSQ